MNIHSMAHASFLVADVSRSIEFYNNLLGLAVDESRPDLGYPGVWFNIGEQQIHLLQLPNPDPVNGRPAHGGRDRHVALYISNMIPLTNRLSQNNIEFTRSKSGRVAIFFRDPDGNAIEIIEKK